MSGIDPAVVRALGDPRFYPHRPDAVEHVQTHISHVFLAGPYVYKLKKAVRFPFLDFGTAERRFHFCTEEVRLNRRLAAGVYLDVIPITRDADGALRLGGAGKAVEHVVWMRRLPADRLLVNLLATAAATDEMMDLLARTLATFHASAPSGDDVAAHAAPDSLRARWTEEAEGTAPFVGDLLAVEDHEVLADFGRTFIETHETLLRARQHGDRIREGHGDLHAEHVCFLPPPDGVVVFDCIEFSRAFRCNDVASEIAFLAMDLESRDRPDLARRFVAAYAEAAVDPLVSVLLPFYGCYRAGVRGKVEGLASRAADVEPASRDAAAERARGHFALAVRYAWSVGGPAVVACCGLAGTGKTTLARELARTTGFVWTGSDAIRKQQGDRPAVSPYGVGPYDAAAREAVYEALSAEADAALAAGRGIVADATFIRAKDRDRLAAVAAARRCPFVFVECRADERIVRERLEARQSTASLSDARWDTYVAQRTEWEPFGPDEPHFAVDTGGPLVPARTAAIRRLWPWRQRRPFT
jgi:aminoglycoside phosphotransferase family enzyme/predicted kinase